MTRYFRSRRNFWLEVIEENGTFTARLTNRTTGATTTDLGWSSYEICLKVVQDMYLDLTA